MPRPERPLDGNGGALARFAADLRSLRERAGSPSYRSLSARAHYSAAALAAAASGRRLPTLAVTLAYVAACGGDRVEWEARWRALAAGEEAGRPVADGAGPPPYRGLAAYQPSDAQWFFGRQRLVDDLVRQLMERRFLAVFGPSGVGKSSLLRAGLVPAVRQGASSGAAGWPAAVMTPGSRPLAELAELLAGLTGGSAGEIRDDLEIDPERIHLMVRQVLAPEPAQVELLLMVDQFEEVFASGCDPAEPGRFIAALLAACGREDSRCRVVLGMRTDFYGRCAEHPALVSALSGAQVLVGAMSGPEVREAVVKPAERAGLMVEGALVSAVVAEVAGRVGALPLASHALLAAWRRRRGNTITLAGYEAAGGIDGAVAQTAEEVYGGLAEGQRRVVRDLLLRLIDLGEGGVVSRRRMPRAELAAKDPDAAVVLARLAAARLVTLDSDTVEITHEALIRAWPRLQTWVDEDRDGLRIHRQLTAAAAEWEALGRDPGALYRGVRLTVAGDWDRAGTRALTDSEREFLTTSLAGRRREAVATRRRRRVVVAAVTVVCVTVAMLIGAVRIQADRASAERDLSASRQLVASARAQSPLDPELALLLAMRAYQLRPGPHSEAVLRQTTAQSRGTTSLHGHGAEVIAVAYSPDGRRVATASFDGAIRVWDLARGGDPLVLRRPQTAFADVMFSPDGRRLAVVASEQHTAAATSRVAVWDLFDVGSYTVLEGDDTGIARIAYSPDGRRLAGAGWAGDISVWDTAAPGRPTTLRGDAGAILDIAFGPDGRLASGMIDGTVRIWDTYAGRQTSVVGGHATGVRAIAFSPDGHWVASVGGERTVRLWDVAGNRAMTELTGHEQEVNAVAFSPDGRRIATGSTDRTVRVWETAHPTHAMVLRGHRGRVNAVTFSPDGHTLASASGDQTARIWDTGGRTAPAVIGGHPAPTGPSAVSPGGRFTASAGRDGTIQVTGTTPGGPRTVLRGAAVPVHDLALSADGRTLAALTDDGAVRVWTPDNAAVPTVVRCTDQMTSGNRVDIAVSDDGHWIAAACDGHAMRVWFVDAETDRVMSTSNFGPIASARLAFSPGARHVAAGEATPQMMTVWDIYGTGPAVVQVGQGTDITDLAFSPDGKRLATASTDGAIRLWQVDHAHDSADRGARVYSNSGPPAILAGFPGSARTVVFSPNGRYLASIGSDDTIRIWNTEAPAEAIVLPPYGASPQRITFMPDGLTLVTTHSDHTTRIWPCEVCGTAADVLALAGKRTTRRLTDHERRTFGDPP
jgi:WD40 repeat protein